MRKTFLALWLAVFSCSAQDVPSTLPANMRPPANQKLIFKAHGTGDQIYTCKMTNGKYIWTLRGPEARLIGSDHHTLLHHFAGPTWEATDGSSLLGKPVTSLASPDPDSVPWLLLTAIRHQGNGIMSKVLSIQRLNTKGGKAPADGCNSSHSGAEARTPYEAEYYFYVDTQ